MITTHGTLRLLGILVASALGLAVGCASPGPEHVNPKGSYPDAGRGNIDPRDTGGILVVTTPTMVDGSSGRTLTNGPEMRDPVVHTGYSVFDAQGKFVAHVANHSLAPSADEAPMEVSLPEGRYLIQPDEAGTGHDRFWVTVEAEHETRVDVAKLEAPRVPEAQ